jgi:hypothetical protein
LINSAAGRGRGDEQFAAAVSLLGSHREWIKVSKLAVKVQATIYSNEPDEEGHADATDYGADERDEYEA